MKKFDVFFLVFSLIWLAFFFGAVLPALTVVAGIWIYHNLHAIWLIFYIVFAFSVWMGLIVAAGDEN